MNFLKLMLVSALLMSTYLLNAQDEIIIEQRSEIKINGLYLILGAFELDYEYILNEESSIGISAAYFFDKGVTFDWGVTPHYRLYFGKQPAQGFFVEGHASVFGYTDFTYFRSSGGIIDTDRKTQTLGGMGIAVGGKFRTSRGVVVEVNGGLGRVFGDTYYLGTYPRFGINIGKRF